MVVRRLDPSQQPPHDDDATDRTTDDDVTENQAAKDQAAKDAAAKTENADADKPTDETPANDTAARHPQDAEPQHPEAPPGAPENTAAHPHSHPHTDDGRTLADAGVTKGRPPRRERGPGGGLLMGRPFGVPVYVAPSWFLVAALITWVFGGQLDRVLPELGAARYLVSLFFAIAFYASVLVHELAHTVAALRFKLPVRRIQLQFFGGVSEIEKEAETPGREFVLAFVGPLLSLVLAGLFYLAMQPVEPGTVPGVLLAGLMISNLIVAAFNLLPGLPLDGGRMLRAVVWKITGRPMTGTVAAAWIGRFLAVSVLIGLPLLTQSGALGSNAEDNVGMDTVMDALLAAILAAIIWTGAGNSLRVARLREHLPDLRARTLTRRAVPVETHTPSRRPCAAPTPPEPAPSSSSTPTDTPSPSCARPPSSAYPNTAAPGSPSAASPRTSPTACASPRSWPEKTSWTPCAPPPPPSTSSSRTPARSTESSPPPTWNAPS